MKKQSKPIATTTTPVPGEMVLKFSAKDRRLIARAAKYRRVTPVQYVHDAILSQARRVVREVDERVWELHGAEVVDFIRLMNDRTPLTPAQKDLGAFMRGES